MASHSAEVKGPAAFSRHEHAVIARVLGALRSDFLLEAECWFAGGTAIVLKHDEYRLSQDLDFMCSNQKGYRELREAVTMKGVDGLFTRDVRLLRDFRCDQYGLRSIIEAERLQFKLEIVREGRIDLEGSIDGVLGCPLLSTTDQIAEKLMANSDRGKDPAACYRDAFDLGILLMANGSRMPTTSAAKATEAYGDAVWRDAAWTVRHLRERPDELDRAARAMLMDPSLARLAMASVETACADHGQGGLGVGRVAAPEASERGRDERKPDGAGQKTRPPRRTSGWER